MFGVDNNCDAVMMDGVNLSSYIHCTDPSGPAKRSTKGLLWGTI